MNMDFSYSRKLPKDIYKTTYPLEIFHFPQVLLEMLQEKKLISQPVPLEYLHEYLSLEDIALDNNYLNKTMMQFYQLNDKFIGLYQKFVCYLTREVFDFDFLFQKNPIFRFHFPTQFPEKFRMLNGECIQYHSDTMGGHPFEMINAWLPLTKTYRTNALQIASPKASVEILQRFCNDENLDRLGYLKSLPRFYEKLNDTAFQNLVTENISPVEMDVGEVLFFDPLCIHGGRENNEKTTRISLDFRILPIANPCITKNSNFLQHHPRFVRGDIFHSKSARELLSHNFHCDS